MKKLLMIIISQNYANYDVPLPENVILRINLAWCNSIEQLKNILEKHTDHDIFVDLPIGRIKPPNNKYTLEELVPILEENKNIKFLAISNVVQSSDLQKYLELIPKHVNLVPKIESPKGVLNIQSITNALPNVEKHVMLDHDDLFSAIKRENEPESRFIDYVRILIDFCKENKISLLRTVGVIFSDDENRVTQYVK
jgi:citrate lyase beta subunit